jgi:hypothetical protein
MRTAPPVSVSCTGGSLWRALQCLVPACAAAALSAWGAGHAGWPAAAVAGAAALSALAVAALAWWRAAPRAVALQWDGQRWSADGDVVTALVVMDVARGLLVQLHGGPGQRVRWVAISAAETGPAWHGVRTALFARRAVDAASPLADLGRHV